MSLLITVFGTKNSDGGVSINRQSGEVMCRYSAQDSNKPDYRYKKVILNGWPWNLVWNKEAHHAS